MNLMTRAMYVVYYVFDVCYVLCVVCFVCCAFGVCILCFLFGSLGVSWAFLCIGIFIARIELSILPSFSLHVVVSIIFSLCDLAIFGVGFASQQRQVHTSDLPLAGI